MYQLNHQRRAWILYKSDGKEYPIELKVRAPSYFHAALLEELLVGCQLADVVTIIGNLNIVLVRLIDDKS